MTYCPGDAVVVPSDYCPGCGGHTGLMSGIIRGTEDQPHWKLEEEHPGPYYSVLIDHKHNAEGRLVYAERELAPTGRTPR